MIALLMAAAVAAPPIPEGATWAEAYSALSACAANGGSLGRAECEGAYRGLQFKIYPDFSGHIQVPSSVTKWGIGCGFDPIQAQSVCHLQHHLRIYYVDGYLAQFNWNGVKAARIGDTAYPETNGAENLRKTLQILQKIEESDKMLLKVTNIVTSSTEYVEVDLRQFPDVMDFFAAVAKAHKSSVGK